jgi:hypothetical protein
MKANYAAGLSVLLSMATAAHAQWDAGATLDLGAGYGQIALSQSALSGTRSLGRAASRAVDVRAKAPVDTQRAALHLRRDAAVTRMVVERFNAASIRKHPELRSQLMAATRELYEHHRRFLDRLRRHGLSPDNLADVTAMYYLAIWQVVHDRVPSGKQIQAVQRQFRAQMAQESALAKLDARARQEIADTLALHGELTLEGEAMLKRKRDDAQLAAFRRGLRTDAVPNGPDIAAMRLTDHGFVAR